MPTSRHPGGARAALHPLQDEFARLADYPGDHGQAHGAAPGLALDLPDAPRAVLRPPLLLQLIGRERHPAAA
ncbi:MAG: hypothetical protein IPJ36_19150 [Simplicispira sp.]|nr:hypothetical protein [Simplicispira sp.]